MKTNRIMRRLTAGILASAAALLWLGDAAQAQPSPVGDWDLKFSRQRLGTGQVTFFSDFTLTGYQITTVPKQKSASINPRTGLPDNTDSVIDPRTGAIITDDNGTVVSQPKLIGEATLDGVWSFDVSGRVIGSYIETVHIPEGGSNRVVINPYSFRGTVSPGRSLNLSVQGPSASIGWQGKPTIALRDLTGSYYARSTAGGIPAFEFFTLSPTAMPNVYDVLGSGPNYTYSGSALYVRQGTLSMVTGTDGTNTVIRSVTGGLRTSRLPIHGALKGQQTGVEGTVQFQINQ